MVEIGALEPRELVEGMLLWTGKGRSSWPLKDDARVRSGLGLVAAERVLPLLRLLKADYYQTNARFAADDLATIGRLASAEFRSRNPDVPEAVVEVLEWCYTFDFK